MIILGIDPGKSGALAFLDTEKLMLSIYDMPTEVISKPNAKKQRSEVNCTILNDIMWLYETDEVYLEEVWSSPQMGVTSAFSFGDSYAACRGVVAGHGLRLIKVRPQTWMGSLKVTSSAKMVRDRASALFPAGKVAFKRVKDDGRADAALIALYGTFCNKISLKPIETVFTNGDLCLS